MITDLRSLKVSCHTKFRFAEREAQCILGECGPLKYLPKSNMAVVAASPDLTRVAENSALSELEENMKTAGWYCK